MADPVTVQQFSLGREGIRKTVNAAALHYQSIAALLLDKTANSSRVINTIFDLNGHSFLNFPFINSDISKWDYVVLNQQQPTPGFTQLTPPTTGWAPGIAPFGQRTAGTGPTLNTLWPLYTTLWLRKSILCPAGVAVSITIDVENGAIMLMDGVIIAAANQANVNITDGAHMTGIIGPYAVDTIKTVYVKGYDEAQLGGVSVELYTSGTLYDSPAKPIVTTNQDIEGQVILPLIVGQTAGTTFNFTQKAFDYTVAEINTLLSDIKTTIDAKVSMGGDIIGANWTCLSDSRIINVIPPMNAGDLLRTDKDGNP